MCCLLPTSMDSIVNAIQFNAQRTLEEMHYILHNRDILVYNANKCGRTEAEYRLQLQEQMKEILKNLEPI